MGLCFGTMCEHVVVEHQIFYWLKYRKHSTAQQSARTEPQSKCVPIRVRQRKQADILYCSTASTAQNSAISPHKAAKQVRADQSATTQASRQSWRDPAHACRACIQHAEFSKRTKKSKSARSTKIYNYSHSAGVMHEGLAFSFDLFFLSFFLCISYMHAASGLLSWSMELLAFASRRYAPKGVDPSVHFIGILSRRSGRRNPPAELIAL